jgi:hypothetical protein
MANDYLDSLNELADLSTNVFEMTHLLESATNLLKKAVKLNEYLESYKTEYGSNNKTDKNADDNNGQNLNSKLMKIVRVLNSAYVRAQLYPIKELVELDQNSDEARFLKTGLVRRKNELMDAINRAIDEIDSII